MFKRYLLITFVILSTLILSAQSAKNRVLSIPVIRNGIVLTEPWVGGTNAPQFSSIDLNRDGIPDLFVFDRDGNKVLTYLSNGGGTDTQYTYAPQYESLFPAGMNQFALIRDYNNDGIPDIFTFANTFAGFEVYKGSMAYGYLNFTLASQAVQYTDSPYTTTIFVNYNDIPVLTDVNHDGYIDILTYDVFGSNVGYYQNLAGTYPGNPQYSPDSLKFTQITSCWGNFSQSLSSNSITLNTTCKGGSGQPVSPPTAPRHAGNSLYNFEDPTYHTVDLLNGNIGYENLIFVQNCGDSSYANACVEDSIYPLCDVPMIMPVYPAAFGVDVNNDGLEDVLIAPNQITNALDVNNVTYYKNTGDPSCPYEFTNDSFLVHNMLDFGTDSKGLFYDFDGDGLLDIIVGNFGYFQLSNPYKSTLGYYKNTGTATHPEFTMQTTDVNNISAYGLQGVDPAFGDLNGDGKPDLVIGDITGNLYYFQNMATGAGSSFPSMTTSDYFTLNVGANAAPFIYDVSGDSLNDLIVGQQNGTLLYYWNFGTKTSPQFSPDSVNNTFGNINVTVYPNSVGYSQPYIFDSAGHLKLYVGSLIGSVYEYDINPDSLRHGGFNLITTNFLNQYIGAKSTISIADINNDGAMEYLVGNSRGGLLMYSDSAWDPRTSPLAIQQIQDNPQQLKIFPNPAKDYFVCSIDNVEFKNPKTEVFNLLGEKMNIDAAINNAQRITVNTTDLISGFYIVRIVDSGKVWTGKLLLEK